MTASPVVLSEQQFMEALRHELVGSKRRSGISAVLRVRVNAHMATVSLVGERNAKNMLLLPSGDRLRQCVRSSDLVAHAKPGVFLMLLKNMNSEGDLEAICERIIRAGQRPFRIDDTQVYTGFSVGAAIITDQHTDPVSLVSGATVIMYQHNRYGDGGFELFPGRYVEKNLNPAEIESHIPNALRKDLIELDFQPQYRSDGTLIGAAAMIRMYSPDGQRLNGEEFLPRVEERKLIVQVSERALGQLCFQAGDWLRRGIRIPSLSIAVADPHFLQEDFPNMVKVLLQNAGIPGSLLEFELTESMIMTEFECAKRAMTELAKLGVRFVLCGVSPGPFLTSCLPRLPIGTLQVSCSRNSLPSVGSIPLLRAVISQGHRLGLRVASKDIQSVEQRVALHAAGCDGFQGPLFSDPLSKEKMEQVLMAWSSLPEAALGMLA
jgi:EAL domain-containing protein (putative c-di-GMP-specific phosphodiesterase class I)